MQINYRAFIWWIFIGCAIVWASLGCKKEQKATPQPNSPASATPVATPLSTPAAANTPKPASPDNWPVAEEFDFDWKGDGSLFHFKIQQDLREQLSRLTIHVPGQSDFVLDSDDIWEEFANDFIKGEKFLSEHKNLVSSQYVYALTPAQTALPLVMMVTPAYASSPGNLHVFALDSAGRPKVILKTQLHIHEFRDLNDDGIAEIVGAPCFSQTWGHDLLTYDPLHVYQLQITPEPQLKLSLPLTEKYNLEHYYGWAGPDCSEKFAVVLHPPGGGKPVVMKSDEAEKMFEEKK